MTLQNQSIIKIAMVAGEASGDQLGVHLMDAIRQKLPNAQFFGIGGAKMCGQGFDSWFPIEKIAVRGFVEVVRHLREISKLRGQLKSRLSKEKPDIFIGIDAPDFNFNIEKHLKNQGVPAVHYVSPSIWAWRASRINKIKRSVSKILTLFPFEPEIYEEKHIPVAYVGHPLADILPVEDQRGKMRELLKIPEDRPVFTLLPGSGRGELHYMADTFIETAREIFSRQPEALFLVPLVTRETRDLFEMAIFKKEAANYPFRLLFGHAHEAMAAADVVIVASGTAALEAALAKRPMIVVYKMAKWTHKIVKALYRLPYVSLPNILAGKFVVPEFIQEDATPKNIAQAALNVYQDKAARTALAEHFAHLHLELKQNTAERAAVAILDLLPSFATNNHATTFTPSN